MAGSSYGNIFRVTTWGESHGKGLGVVVDGVPAGLSLIHIQMCIRDRYISITAIPACFARRIRSEYTAGIVPFPRSPIPSASVRPVSYTHLDVYKRQSSTRRSLAKFNTIAVGFIIAIASAFIILSLIHIQMCIRDRYIHHQPAVRFQLLCK